MELGVTGKMLQLIMEVKREAQQCINICGHDSDEYLQTMGNRQGGVLEPLEWLLFYDDFLKFLDEMIDTDKAEYKGLEICRDKEKNFVCYADDLETMYRIDENHSFKNSKKHVNGVISKFKEKFLKANAQKCG